MIYLFHFLNRIVSDRRNSRTLTTQKDKDLAATFDPRLIIRKMYKLKSLKQQEISEQIEEATNYDIQELTESEVGDFDECSTGNNYP